MDGISTAQLHLDFRTGRPSAIYAASSCAEQRAACVALNRQRARGILEAAQLAPPGESLSPDVWDAAFARRSREWDLALIPLEKLGIYHDADGLMSSSGPLQALTSGAEACPYFDPDWKVVYKLFDLRANGSLGKKISLESNDEGEFEICVRDAVLKDTLEKLSVLNEAGAHPTEIVGLSDNGDYLIAKQPLAGAMVNFLEDRDIATCFIHGVNPEGTGLRQRVTVIWLNEQPWLVSDLHERNIMRDLDGHPTIIDALIGPVPLLALKQLAWLRDAVEDAQALRLGKPLPIRKKFDEGVDDDAL